MKNKLKKLAFLRNYHLGYREHRNIIAFTICLLIATALWFLNALNKNYTINLSYPVTYTNLPNDKMLTNTPPKHFELKVKAGGFSILRHKLSMSFTPLVLDVKTLSLFGNTKHSSSNICIPTEKLEEYISSQISAELSILAIKPDSIFLNFDKLTKKRVRIKPNISLAFVKQHFISNEITFSPDSIDVYGPLSIIDTIQAIYTQKQRYEKLSQPIRRNVSLQEIKNLQYTPKRVIMDVPVEEFTEKIIYVPIHVINQPEHKNIKLFPDKAKISFLVSLSNFSSVSEQDFQLVVDYSSLSQTSDLLDVNLLRSPSHIYSTNVNPLKVEYLLQHQ